MGIKHVLDSRGYNMYIKLSKNGLDDDEWIREQFPSYAS